MKRWEQKDQIQGLRRQGFSYREILARVPFILARSTMSHWCRDIELTSGQLDRLDQLKETSWYRHRLLGAKTNQRRRAEEVAAIRAEARIAVPDLARNMLWVAGLMLYWAEGSKTSQVELSNSDPRIARLMMRWFRECCLVPEEKFKAYLNIHSGQDDAVIKAYWSGVTGIPVARFGKSYIKQEGTGHRKNILYQGTIKVTICNRNLLHKIHGWIEGFSTVTLGPLAQLVEQGILNPKDTGSSPVRPIFSINASQGG